MFENETKLNSETNIKLVKHTSRKIRVVGCISCLCLMILAGALLPVELLVWKDGDELILIVLIALGAVGTALSFVFYPLIEHIFKKTMQGKESTVKYIFREEGYEVFSPMDDGSLSSTYGNYPALTKCREYADMWLFYIRHVGYKGFPYSSMKYMVLKDGMTKGTAEELSQFLLGKFGTKYKVCYKKR
ncbi:MAG: hypothetical protein K2K12_04600 [Clostridia bacterium]|nr:hypothetical protein [Clostridia bacterium]